MADDRPIEMPEEQIGRLETELADLKALFNARFGRRPTGDVEPTIRNTPKADTLLLNGGTYNRADYPDLWQWAQDAGLVIAGMFTAGNGTTTFTVPNFAGRVPIGVGTLGTDTYALGNLVGAARVALTTAELAAHTHTTTSDSHSHTGNTNDSGSHGGHCSGSTNVTQSGSGVVLPGNYGASNGNHSHSFTTSSDSHTHTISSTGSGTAHENRQPSIAINWLIWT